MSASPQTYTQGHRVAVDPGTKRMPSSLSKLLLHKPQSSNISIHKLKLKDKVMRLKMALDLF